MLVQYGQVLQLKMVVEYQGSTAPRHSGCDCILFLFAKFGLVNLYNLTRTAYWLVVAFVVVKVHL